MIAHRRAEYLVLALVKLGLVRNWIDWDISPIRKQAVIWNFWLKLLGIFYGIVLCDWLLECELVVFITIGHDLLRAQMLLAGMPVPETRGLNYFQIFLLPLIRHNILFLILFVSWLFSWTDWTLLVQSNIHEPFLIWPICLR